MDTYSHPIDDIGGDGLDEVFGTSIYDAEIAYERRYGFRAMLMPENSCLEVVGVLAGWAACAVGLFCALWGLLNISVAYEALGVVLGVVGYALGASRLAAATVVVSVVLLVVVLAAAQGYVPGGVEASDPGAR